MSITYDQATAKAAELRKQALKWPEIAERLRAEGYISPHTNRPVGYLAIRQMVVKRLEKLAAEKARPTQVQSVSAPKMDLVEAIRAVTLLDSDAVGVDTKLKLVQHLIKTADAF